MSNEPRIETFLGIDEQWYNRVIAANNEVLMLSEGFPTKKVAKDNISAMEDAMAAIISEEEGNGPESPAA